ncbi:MAG: hypothetical protein QW730_05655, partial [Candidatus Nezhaarchaeales archaeon]
MRFRLKGYIVLSKQLDPEGVKKLSEMMSEANRTLLVKGVPRGKEQEAARVISWAIDSERIHL